MLKHPQAKGKSFEYEVRDLIRGYGFKDAQRSPMSGAIHFLQGDILSKKFPYFIEAKHTEKTEFYKWYKKAETQCKAKPPIIVWRKNRGDIFCFLMFSDFMDLLTNKQIIRSEFKKKKEHDKLTLDETSNLKFSKSKQLRKNAR